MIFERKPIPGYPGYFADKSGGIWSWKTYRWKRLKQAVAGNNGRMVYLYREGKYYGRLVHRLVLETFIGPCPAGMECCHNNGDRTNNSLSNLRWDTHRNNERDKIAHGTIARGERNGVARLTRSDVRTIKRRYTEGETQAQIARSYGVSPETVRAIVKCRSWRWLPIMLTGDEIRLQRDLGKIVIEPWNGDNLGPNSYNLTLHPEIIVYPPWTLLDMKKENPGIRVLISNDGFVLQPNMLVLGRTVEHTETYGYIPCIEGRSSLARLGISPHVSAGFGDIGYCGTWTLEFSSVVAAKIYPWTQVCQISYQLPVGKITQTYKGKYQGAKDVISSRLSEELTS